MGEWYADVLEDEAVAAAKLVVSELVTNAVVHGSGRIRLHAALNDERLLVEVTDEGDAFEYTVRNVPFRQLHGLGLGIVDATSSRWGIYDGTTHAWAEIERPGPRVGSDKRPET